MIRTLGFAAVLSGLAAALPAQRTDDTGSVPARSWIHPVERYGKWASAVAAIGFTILAAHEHQTANVSWNQLLALCTENNAACVQRADGHYVDSDAERLYQRTVYYDRRARRRLIAGQVALLASATLFILDLRHSHGQPPNIPFHGLEVTAEPSARGARLRVALPF